MNVSCYREFAVTGNSYKLPYKIQYQTGLDLALFAMQDSHMNFSGNRTSSGSISFLLYEILTFQTGYMEK